MAAADYGHTGRKQVIFKQKAARPRGFFCPVIPGRE
jgi:hypothetical protein